MGKGTGVPASILCSEIRQASPPQIYLHQLKCCHLITNFHQLLYWYRLKGEKNLVFPSHDEVVRHYWQEHEEKHQNILFLTENVTSIPVLDNPALLPQFSLLKIFTPLGDLGSGHKWIMRVQENNNSWKRQGEITEDRWGIDRWR